MSPNTMHQRHAPVLVLSLLLLSGGATPRASAQGLVDQFVTLGSIWRLGQRVEESQTAFAAGRFAAARDQLQAALTLLERIDADPESDPLGGNKPEIKATLLSYLGMTGIYTGRLGEAVPALTTSRDLFAAIGRHDDRMTVQQQLAIALDRAGRHAEAEVLLDELLAYYEAHHSAEAIGHTLMNQCGLYLAVGRLEDALPACDRGASLLAEQGDPAAAAQALSLLARALAHSGAVTRARRTDTEALALGEHQADPFTRAIVLANSGLLQTNLGDYATALERLAEAEQVFERLGAVDRQARTLLGSSHANRRLGLTPLAATQARRALALLEATGNEHARGQALIALGRARLQQGQTSDALASFGVALGIAEHRGDPPGRAEALHGQAAAYLQLGRYLEAREVLEQAWRIALETGYQCRRCEADTGLGQVLLQLGRVREAVTYYRRALVQAQALDARGLEGTIRLRLAALMTEFGHRPAALEHAERALEVTERTGNEADRAAALLALGRVQLLPDRGITHPAQAIAYGNAADDLSRRLHHPHRRAEAQLLVAAALVQSARPALVEERLRAAMASAREASNPWLQAVVAINLADLALARDDPETARGHCRAGRRLLDDLDSRDRWRGQLCQARIEALEGRNEEALALFRRVVDALDGQRDQLGDRALREGFAQGRGTAHERFLRFLLDLHRRDPEAGHDREALAVFERGRARAFLDDMGRSIARRYPGKAADRFARETDLAVHLEAIADALETERLRPIQRRDAALVEALLAERERTASALDAVRARLRTEHPRAYRRAHPRPVDSHRLQKEFLAPGELLLVYSVQDEVTLLWLVTGSDLHLLEIPIPRRRLRRRVEALLAGYAKAAGRRGFAPVFDAPDPPPAPGSHPTLYDLLLPPPVRAALAGAERLLVVPTDILHALPFEALSPKSAATPAGRPAFLIEHLEVAYLSSASLLRLLRGAERGRRRDRKLLLAVADPVHDPAPPAGAQGSATDPAAPSTPFGPLRLRPLPETREEVRAIAATLSRIPGDSRLLLGREASRQTLLTLDEHRRLAEYRYLVFATHGLLAGDVDRLRQPALVLSRPYPDGLLTATDVYGLTLAADLVSLAACNTALGDVHYGEGPASLSRAFLYAGSDAVVATLWSVDSPSAALLDRRLFHHLAQGSEAAAAVRSAKLEFLSGRHGEDYRHPYFWAPFVVFGAAEIQAGQTPGTTASGVARGVRSTE